MQLARCRRTTTKANELVTPASVQQRARSTFSRPTKYNDLAISLIILLHGTTSLLHDTASTQIRLAQHKTKRTH